MRGKGERGNGRCAEASRQLLPRASLMLGNCHNSRKDFFLRISILIKKTDFFLILGRFCMWERGKGERGKEKCAEAARQLLPRVFLKLGNFHKSRKAFLRKLNLMKKKQQMFATYQHVFVPWR